MIKLFLILSEIKLISKNKIIAYKRKYEGDPNFVFYYDMIIDNFKYIEIIR